MVGINCFNVEMKFCFRALLNTTKTYLEVILTLFVVTVHLIKKFNSILSAILKNVPISQ